MTGAAAVPPPGVPPVLPRAVLPQAVLPRAAPSPPVLPPPVLPLAPRQGWAGAGTAQRALALACPATLAVWVVLAGLSVAPGPGLVRGYLVLGPLTCAAAARVLRPHPPGPQVERHLRHGCAAAATAYGLVLLVLLVLPPGRAGAVDGPSTGVMVVVALLLGPLTLLWGLVALAVRAGLDTRDVSRARPRGDG